MFDTYEEKKDRYTSLIPAGREPVGINWNNKWNKSHEMLMRLNDDTDFDFLRDNEEFINLMEQLKLTDNAK